MSKLICILVFYVLLLNGASLANEECTSTPEVCKLVNEISLKFNIKIQHWYNTHHLCDYDEFLTFLREFKKYANKKKLGYRIKQTGIARITILVSQENWNGGFVRFVHFFSDVYEQNAKEVIVGHRSYKAAVDYIRDEMDPFYAPIVKLQREIQRKFGISIRRYPDPIYENITSRQFYRYLKQFKKTATNAKLNESKQFIKHLSIYVSPRIDEIMDRGDGVIRVPPDEINRLIILLTRYSQR